MPVTGAVILGAGAARRFGSDKRLHPLGDNTVAYTTCKKYCEVFTHVRVVLKPGDHHLSEVLAPLAPDIIYAQDAHLGMGHSLAAGFAGLTWQWAFVALMDMPYIRTSTLRHMCNLVENTETAAIFKPQLSAAARAQHAQLIKQDQAACHPIVWHADYFAEIQQCNGDQGARNLLNKHSKQIVSVEVDDIGVLQDIDQPADIL